MSRFMDQVKRNEKIMQRKANVSHSVTNVTWLDRDKMDIIIEDLVKDRRVGLTDEEFRWVLQEKVIRELELLIKWRFAYAFYYSSNREYRRLTPEVERTSIFKNESLKDRFIKVISLNLNCMAGYEGDLWNMYRFNSMRLKKQFFRELEKDL